jgi:hypothetical protein
MAIPPQLVYQGPNKEFQFRDEFVMPLLVRLGFGVVVNYHGQREFGRDVVFGDIDRFGHVVYYGMQIKYESSISLGDSHSIIQDAEQATHNPFTHPHTGKSEYISTFFLANAGDISGPARENFFSVVKNRGVRDARLMDGNALILLDKAAALNRNANIRERLTGLLQEVRRNRHVIRILLDELPRYASSSMSDGVPYPMLRCRYGASDSYLNAPFPIDNLHIGDVDAYWETMRVLNALADSVGVSLAHKEFREGRAAGFVHESVDAIEECNAIENAVVTCLGKLSESGLLI